MSMSLKLDSSALAALFPEGTEARLELQRAVLAEFCRQHIKASWIKDGIEDELAELRRSIRAEVLETLQVKNSWGEFTKLFRDELRTEVQGHVKTLRDEQIKEEVAEHFAGAALDSRVESIVDRLMKDRVNPIVETRVQDHVRAILGSLGSNK